MTYKVIKYFTDALDNHFAYNTGDIFPRKGATASAERIEELSTNKNKRGYPLIKAIDADKPAKVDKPVTVDKPVKAEKTVKADKPAEAKKPAQNKPKTAPKKSTTTTKGKKKNV